MVEQFLKSERKACSFGDRLPFGFAVFAVMVDEKDETLSFG